MVAKTRTQPGASGSVTVTLVRVTLPVLVTAMVKVTTAPGSAVLQIGRLGDVDGGLGDDDLGRRRVRRGRRGHAGRRGAGDGGQVGEAGQHVGHRTLVAGGLAGVQRADVARAVGRLRIGHRDVGQGDVAGVGDGDGEGGGAAGGHVLQGRFLVDGQTGPRHDDDPRCPGRSAVLRRGSGRRCDRWACR